MLRLAADLRPAAITPHDVVRVILGLILLSAAALKAFQLATEPVAESGLLSSRWFLIGIVEFELFFGLWLLVGPYPRRTWQLAVLCFGGFACVSLYKAVSGEASCGCFGRVPIHPWYTLILDLGAVTALFCFRPVSRAASSHFPLAGDVARVGAEAGMHLARALGLFLAAGLPAGLAMGTYRPATLDDSGAIFGDSEFVVLEPEKWIGQRFPLLKYIDIGEQLAEGKWIVVLYRHDCAHCQEVIPRYKQRAQELARRHDAFRVALIEIPPFGDLDGGPVLGDSPCVTGRLNDAKEWFVATPLEVVLEQSTTSAVASPGLATAVSFRDYLGGRRGGLPGPLRRGSVIPVLDEVVAAFPVRVPRVSPLVAVRAALWAFRGARALSGLVAPVGRRSAAMPFVFQGLRLHWLPGGRRASNGRFEEIVFRSLR